MVNTLPFQIRRRTDDTDYTKPNQCQFWTRWSCRPHKPTSTHPQQHYYLVSKPIRSSSSELQQQEHHHQPHNYIEPTDSQIEYPPKWRQCSHHRHHHHRYPY
jgi:hypothetical protein